MSTTISRQQRRALNKIMQSVAHNSVIYYESDPYKTLKACWKSFGREQFEKILSQNLQRCSIRTALRSTILACSVEAVNGKSVAVSESSKTGR
jgi:uncharacterized protein with ATP-grasp and redox domains